MEETTACRVPDVGRPRLLVSDPSADNVALTLTDLHEGTVCDACPSPIPIAQDIPAGHKVALTDIPAGQAIVKYGAVIGYATTPITLGSHVHVHNVAVRGAASPNRGAARRTPVSWTPPVVPTRDHFLGYERPGGAVATRNYIGILPSVNCAATVSRMVARAAEAAHAGTPGLDGVIALGHDLGCGLAEGGPGDAILRRTLRGYAAHPNLVGVVSVSLGCEVNQPEHFLEDLQRPVEQLTIQELGGSAATVNEALRRVAVIATEVAGLRREPLPLSGLTLGLQCGGSDAYSGLTANPALGVAADLLVAAGGRAILGETPEIFGAEHLLAARAAEGGLVDRLDEILEWWKEYVRANGAELDNNPSRGNRDGGITTIWEKSLGAVLKGGSSPLRAVVDYAQRVEAPGLTFMDTPGYDPVSATGMVAGGANLLAFTTGRGSVFGSRPAPCLKITTTSRLYRHMVGDMDFDAGAAFTREEQIATGTRLFERLVDLASGEPSKSELFGFGSEEIAPWRIGAVL
ncbi:UxaA family hydrolase [Streptomyces sp. NPDC058470]|uniref:UxaA family hydrolase n=1 Tax=Streptomyces sp. NPDC058470 TaxID=3346515 RepID=UPI0036538105